MKMGHLLVGSALALALPHAASAAITWTDWQQAGTGTVFGTAGSTGVTYTGNYAFAQTNGGADYWNNCSVSCWDGDIPPPPDSDIIALSPPGTHTITFSSAVQEVYFALTSWNGQTSVVFDRAFTQVGWNDGCGYWGCGLINQTTPVSFSSTGESHGILKFAGPVTSLTFTNSDNEFWHGFQIGISAVPEPSTWAMLILGFGAVGGAMRKSRKASLAFA